MISSSVRNKEFEKQNTKKNTWENKSNKIEMKTKTNIPNILFFFDFSNPWKTNKDQIFKLKNSFENLYKILEKMKFLLFKNLVKTGQRLGFK